MATSRPAPAFLPDTSCIVAAVCSWHEHHLRAVDAIDGRCKRKERMIAAAPALIEAYSVLTRLPAPHRLAPDDALSLIEANFVRGVMCVALSAAKYRAVLRAAPGEGLTGGRVYDAVIAQCARQARARTLLTFNASHFASFAGPELAIVVPT